MNREEKKQLMGKRFAAKVIACPGCGGEHERVVWAPAPGTVPSARQSKYGLLHRGKHSHASVCPAKRKRLYLGIVECQASVAGTDWASLVTDGTHWFYIKNIRNLKPAHNLYQAVVEACARKAKV